MGPDNQNHVHCWQDFHFILSRWEQLEFCEPRTNMTGLTFLKVTQAAGLRKDYRKARAGETLIVLMDWMQGGIKGDPKCFGLSQWTGGASFAKVEKMQEEWARVKGELKVWFGHDKVDKIYNYLNGDGKQAAEHGVQSPGRRPKIVIVIWELSTAKKHLRPT